MYSSENQVPIVSDTDNRAYFYTCLTVEDAELEEALSEVCTELYR